MHVFLKTALFSSVFVIGAAASFSMGPHRCLGVPVASARASAAEATGERTLQLRFESLAGTQSFTTRIAPNRCVELNQKAGRAELDLDVCQDGRQTINVKFTEWVSTDADTSRHLLNFSFEIDSKTLIPVASWQSKAGGVVVSASVN